MLTFENRAFRDIAANAPYDVVEILVNSADVRRRRHLRPVQHGRGRQRVGAVHLRPRVRPSPRRPGRRVLHVGRRVSAGDRSRRAVGAERDGAARSGEAQVEGSRRRRARRCRRRGRRRSSSSTRRRARSGAARFARAERPEAEMDALFREELARTTRRCSGAARTRAKSARSRAPTTRRRATTGRRPTASCSRATRCRSAPSAGARWSRSSILTRGR